MRPPNFRDAVRVKLFVREALSEKQVDAGIEQEAPPPLWRGAYVIAAAYLCLHLLTSTRYGIFRDAMYLLDCGRHLAWGYVDQPPLFPFLAWIASHTLGTSLPALIFWPALAGAGRIVLTTALARELGARRFGMAATAVLSACVPGWLIIDHQFSMNAFEPLFWAGCALVAARMIRTGNLRLWLLFGVIAGLGFQNKYSLAGFAAALIAGLLLTPQRRILFTPWLLAGGAVALVISLPNLIWEIANQWPFLQFLHNVAATGKDVILSPGAFLAQQVLLAGPALLPFWLAGLLYLLTGRRAKPYRALGYCFVLTLILFLLTHGKNYYSLPIYPLVFAAAGVVLERWLAGRWFGGRSVIRRTMVPVMAVWVAASVILLLPMLLPVLPIEEFLKYQEHLPFTIPRSETSHLTAALPQYYADEFGWEDMVKVVARIYHGLSPEDQKKAAIVTSNYGQAAAIDYFGPKYGLPDAISGHNTFWLWGTHGYTGEIVIRVGSNLQNERRVFESAEVAGIRTNPYVLFYERGPIFLCRGLKNTTLQKIWPDEKHWE